MRVLVLCVFAYLGAHHMFGVLGCFRAQCAFCANVFAWLRAWSVCVVAVLGCLITWSARVFTCFARLRACVLNVLLYLICFII